MYTHAPLNTGTVFILHSFTSLNFKRPGWHLNFTTRFMKNMSLFEQKKDKIMNESHFVENKTRTMQRVFKTQQNFLFPTYIKFLGVFSHLHAGRLEVKVHHLLSNVTKSSSSAPRK